MNYDLFLFSGHGEGDIGACANGYKEKELSEKVVKRVITLLQPYNINIHTNGELNNYKRNLTKGNKYNMVEGLSIHFNASNGKGCGCEIWVPCRLSNFSMQENIVRNLECDGYINRGVKSRDYDSELTYQRKNGDVIYCTDYYKEIREAYENGYYLSILEICFIDNINDMKLFNEKFENICQSISSGIIYRYGLKKNEVVNNIGSDSKTYRVITGSFKNRENAENQVGKLKEKGFNSFIEIK